MVTEERDIPTRRTADVQLRGGVHGRVYWPAPGADPAPLLVLFAAATASLRALICCEVASVICAIAAS